MSSFEEEDAYLYDEPRPKKLRQNEDKDVCTCFSVYLFVH